VALEAIPGIASLLVLSDGAHCDYLCHVRIAPYQLAIESSGQFQGIIQDRKMFQCCPATNSTGDEPKDYQVGKGKCYA
jgi:hypothetical protein